MSDYYTRLNVCCFSECAGLTELYSKVYLLNWFAESLNYLVFVFNALYGYYLSRRFFITF